MSKNKVTIYDVASRLGLSTATVNRAINNKPNVSDRTRAAVLKTIEEMGYRPSKTAASLSRTPIHISVLIGASIKEFHKEIARGAKKALDDLFDFNVRGEVRVIEKRPAPDLFIKAMYEEAEQGADAIAIVSHKDESAVINAMHDLYKKGIKFSFGVSEIHEECNTFCVKSNGCVAGKMAAELLQNMLKDGKVAIVVGTKNTDVHSSCLKGFSEFIDSSSLEFIGCYENFDDERMSENIAEDILKQNPDVKGIYISTANSINFLKKIEEMGVSDSIKIIASDIFPELAEFMDRGVVNASIFQNPYLTGRLLVENLYENMIEPGKYQNKFIRTDPQVVLNSNKDLFLAHMKEQ